MNNNDSLKMYVISHKKYNKKNLKDYVSLFVGAEKYDEIPEGYIGDDTYFNISEKNDSYCELTGLYWIWKNVSAEYVGLVHYRRYFVKFDCFSRCIRGRYFVTNKNRYHILSSDEILELLGKYEIVVKESPCRLHSTWNEFCSVFGEEYCNQIKKIVYENYPEYKFYFDECMKKTIHFNCNMFIGRKELVNKYCEWLFDILDEMDKCNIEKTGHCYHNRELGYIGELLFRVWIEKNNINYYINPAINIEDKNSVMTFAQFIRFTIKWILNK